MLARDQVIKEDRSRERRDQREALKMLLAAMASVEAALDLAGTHIMSGKYRQPLVYGLAHAKIGVGKARDAIDAWERNDNWQPATADGPEVK